MVPGSVRTIPKFDDKDFIVSSLTGDKCYCVAVACKNGVIAVRDSNNPSLGTLHFDKEEWEAFTGGVKKGEFDFSK